MRAEFTRDSLKCTLQSDTMRFYGISLAVLSLVTVIQANEEKPFLKMNTIKIITACKQDNKAQRDDYDAIRKSETPTTENGKCFLACLFDKFQVVQNGAFSIETFSKRLTELYKEDPDKLEKAMKMANECKTTLNGVQETNKCQYAPKVLECFASYKTKIEVVQDLLKYQKIKSS
uniref:Chemosensory protein n=1 Tax=Blattella germanica TaxID=6973 RepID=A0A0X8DCA0_BLAGE|nr:chemosensory protein [Blattella germanica]